MTEPSAKVGYKRPPANTRFKPGQSGNPRGRPRNRHANLPHEHILGQTVTVRDDQGERRVTAAEAFLLHLIKKGLQGHAGSLRAALGLLEVLNPGGSSTPDVLKVLLVSVGGSGQMLELLGMGVKRHRLDKKKVKWVLKHWIVEAALARLGPNALTPEEQQIVWNTTYRPSQVCWPEWWTVRS